MINKPFKDITFEDIQYLKDNQIIESKTIEYKKEHSYKDSDFVKMLAGISAMANSNGGDFIIGIEAKDGIPINIDGIEIEDIDKEKLTLENKIRDGIDPRFSPVSEIAFIPIESDNRYVVIIRVYQSWNAPHRVKANSKFYARNSAGKYELDVSELRIAFNLSEQLSDKIRNFRIDRIAKIYSDETPIPLVKGAKFIFHFLPLSAFTNKENSVIDLIKKDFNTYNNFPIDIYNYYNAVNYNFEGIISYDQRGYGYTQFYKNGIIETVSIYGHKASSGNILFNIEDYLEQYFCNKFKFYLEHARKHSIFPPFYLFMSLIHIKGYELSLPRNHYSNFFNPNPIERNELFLPEIIVDSFEIDQLEELFMNSLDMIKNAFGFDRNYSR